MRCGVEHPPSASRPRSAAALDAGDPLREADPLPGTLLPPAALHLPRNTGQGRQIAIKVLDSLNTCPIPKVARLGRTLRAWRAQILAYFDTHGVSNGGTEAINLIIEKVRRLAHGFKDFDHYRHRILLAADGSRPLPEQPEPPSSPKARQREADRPWSSRVRTDGGQWHEPGMEQAISQDSASPQPL